MSDLNDWEYCTEHAGRKEWAAGAEQDDLERLAAHQQLREASARELADERAQALGRLLEGDWTYRKLAAHFGVSPARVHQWRWPNGKAEQ